MRFGLAWVVVVVAVSPAAADERTLVYGELLGKGGPWGVGVEHPITSQLALGAVASFAPIRGQQLYTLAPYLHVTLRRWLYGELGAVIVHSRVPSPVMSWDGTSDT